MTFKSAGISSVKFYQEVNMSVIGAIENFDGNDFEPYQERLEAYFIANDIGVVTDPNDEAQKKAADKKKVAHAIAAMGKKTYDICFERFVFT